jgi:hypothetical protein
MTSFKCFESKPVVKIIYTYTHCNLWHHRQFITIFHQFLHIRIEIIHGSHMHILFLPRVGLYVGFLSLAGARGKTLWHKGLPEVKTIYTYEQEYGIWTVSDNDRKLIKLDISLIYVVILWPNGCLVC